MEDIFDLVATGVMRGERVALEKMGKLFIRVRPARAARKGRNPLNGARRLRFPPSRQQRFRDSRLSRSWR